MSPIPKLAPKAIRTHVGEASYERGETYFRTGAIFHAKRQGRTLKARCEGSRAEPYRVQVTFDEKGEIAGAECSCPVGDGGFCKHVAALLLTWRARPDDFDEIEDLEASLERRSKSELIALVKQMLRREPDLEVVLETPLPGAGKRRSPANPDVYRRQADAAFRGDYGDYGGGYSAAQELEPILEIADGFLAQSDPASASAVYEGVLDAVIDGYETVDDEGGDVHRVANRCATGLGRCLAELKDQPARREAILKALVAAFDFLHDYGDTEEDIPELIVKATSPDERHTVAGWVRGRLAELKTSKYASYKRERYGDLLIALEGDTLSDKDYLEICREADLTDDLVDRLLHLGRFDEAVREFANSEDHKVLRLADLFVSHKHGEVAERLVRERAEKAKSFDTSFLEWLRKRASARRDRTAVRELTETIFRKLPSFEVYKELRELARKDGNWDALRPELLKILNKSQPDDLVRVYLDEREIDQAIEAVTTERKPRSAGFDDVLYGYPSMRLEVAKAAETPRPRAALEIYRKHAESLIEARGRERYKDACRYLKKVKQLFGKLGEPDAWETYVGDLRTRHNSLRAFKEELTAAKL